MPKRANLPPQIPKKLFLERYGMKITGTKKLLIIFFALICALTAGLGVVITRSASGSIVYAEDTAPSGTPVEKLEEELSDGETDETEEIAEEEYDVRFDDSVISEIADLFGFNPDVVRLYCHIGGYDAQSLLAALIEERDNGIAEQNKVIDYDKDRDGAIPEEYMQSPTPDSEFGDSLREDILAFASDYFEGLVSVSEEDTQKDWFISPDEITLYASGWGGGSFSWRIINFRDNYNTGAFNFYVENLNATTNSNKWTNITSQVINDANLHIPGYSGNLSNVWGNYEYQYNETLALGRNVNANNGDIMTSGPHNFNCDPGYQCGYKITITLEPGQKLRFTTYMNNPSSTSSTNGLYTNYFRYGASNGGNAHWSKILFFGNDSSSSGKSSELIVDGDAPTGCVFFIGKGAVTYWANGRYYYRYCWAPSLFGNAGQGISNNNNVRIYNSSFSVNANTGVTSYGSTALANVIRQSSETWLYWIEIVRKDPPKPVLVDEDTGAALGGDTKTAYFEGEPVTLAVNPDYGSGLLSWSAYTNSSCTMVDTSVSLKSRSNHGVESGIDSNGNWRAANLVVQSLQAGTHYIKYESPTGKWADGSRTPVVFKLVIQTRETARPSMKSETGVAANGKEKEVYYNGQDQTVTFLRADPNLVTYVAPGMTEESWSSDGTLVLKSKERGKYNITLALANPAGCVWADTKTTEAINFSFTIKEQKIEKPKVTQWPQGSGLTHTDTTCEIDYDGTEKTLTISPAWKDQLIIIAAGLRYDFVTVDDDGDGVPDRSSCVFKMTDSATQTITIMPGDGYIWDNLTFTPITFTFKINAVAIDFPTLKDDGNMAGNTKTVKFDPTSGWFTTMVIENCPKDAIVVETGAMTEVSWDVPAGFTKPDGQPIIDFDRSVLTLKASNAQKYVITFALSNTNYRWKNSGSSPPVFILEIKKFQLDRPYIDEQTGKFPTWTVEGNTKTVYYNDKTDIGQPWTAVADRYFKLFVGGFTGGRAGLDSNAGQITIRYDIDGANYDYTDGLEEVWTNAGSSLSGSTAHLTLKGLKASNYLINIAPTSNYEWKDGTNDMVTYKFVVTPISHNTLQMYVKNAGSSSWAPSGFAGEVTFNTQRLEFRIGNENNLTEIFVEDEMEFNLVNNDNREETIPFPTGFHLAPKFIRTENDMRVVVLEGYATDAGVYTIKLSLKDKNYKWQDGTGADIFYTFTVKALSIGKPVLLNEGGGGQDFTVYPDDGFVTAGYNGNPIEMVISVKNSDNIIRAVYDPENVDNDATSPNGKGIWPKSWGSAGYEDGLDRLVVNSVNVGNHCVRLEINDPNYMFDNDQTSFDFYINVDYADVDDIVFSYSANDDAPAVIGGNNSVDTREFDPEVTHKITVTRSTDEFATTPFDTQFTFEVVYSNPNYELKTSTFKSDSLTLEFYDANVYQINIYLTANYRWKSMQGSIGAAMTMTFEVEPKFVSMPKIIDEGEKNEDGTDAASINQTTRVKEITYDATKNQSIAIDFGDDYAAYVVDEANTTSFLNKDTTVSALDKKVRYTAKSAGNYKVVIALSDENNYAWSEGATAEYILKILPRAISLPEAFYIDSKFINNPHDDYEDIKNGINSTLITPDSNNEYITTQTYTGKLHYVYLFGYAVENSEVEVLVTANDPNPADPVVGYGDRSISVSGITRGHYVYATNVCEYTITLKFKLNDEFGTPNCHWSGVNTGDDLLPREFKLVIEKLGIDAPFIKLNPTLTFDVDNKMAYHFTYDGLPTGPTLVIGNCLESSPVLYMSYTYDRSKTDVVQDLANKEVNFIIKNTAQVGTEYLLTVSLDTDNEYWNNPLNPTDKTDFADKLIYIIIDKLGIKAPEILNEGETDATYAADGLSKKFTYTGNAWPNAIRFTNVDYDNLDYKIGDSKMYELVTEANDNLVSGVRVADSGTYPVVFSLNDKINLKWDGTADDSADRTYSLIIDPVRIAKPVLDQTAMNGLFNNVDTYTLDDYNLTVVYHKNSNNEGETQYIIVKNFVNDENQMKFKTSGTAFAEDVIKINNDTALKTGSFAAGVYQLVISPEPNIGWDDGTNGDVVFTLTIEKKEYATPEIDDPALSLTPPEAPTVVDQTRTVTYYLDPNTGSGADQPFIIKDIDEKVLKMAEKSSDDFKFIGTTPGQNGGTDYRFSASKAGEYSIKFNLINFANECLDYDNTKDYVLYKFIINKYELDVPVIDTDGTAMLKDESATSGAYTAVYDAARHGALVLNVRDGNYMTYSPANGEYDMVTGTKKGQFFYGEHVSTTETAPSSGQYMIIDDIFNKSTFDGKTFVTKFDGKFQSPTSNIGYTQLNRVNFILIHAAEPDTYELVFKLKDPVNMQWDDGSVTDKKVKLIIGKKQIAAPELMANSAQSQPYTGKPVTFKLKNVFGVRYFDETANTEVVPAVEYEILNIVSPNGSVMRATGLDTTNNILTLSATDIGRYTVTIQIKDTKYTEWTTGGSIKQFTFEITKKALSPEVKLINPEMQDATGTWVADGVTSQEFGNGNYTWFKSRRVTAQVVIPDLAVENGSIVFDSSFLLDIYYVNTATPTKKLLLKQCEPFTQAGSIFASLPAAGASNTATANGGTWELRCVATPNGDRYDLVFTFLLEPDASHSVDEILGRTVIPKGNYSLEVEQLHSSNDYAVSSASKTFTVDADPAPFKTQEIFDNLIWERYLIGDGVTDATVQTYTREDIFGAGTTTHWDAWVPTGPNQNYPAVSLPFLENGQSYGFRINLDATGLAGPDGTATVTDVRLALQSWQVDWDKTYGGKNVAKYSGDYSVSVTIKALYPELYSFPDTTYTFYYKISKIVYDLAGLEWDYDGTNPFVYDGTTKTVKLKGTLPEGLSIASYDVAGFDRNSQISAKYDNSNPADPATNYHTSVVFASNNPNYEVPDVNNANSYTDSSGQFKWDVVWGIKKAQITANWSSKMTGDGSATMSIPTLDDHGEKVNYTFYRDNGDADPLNWTEVTTFEHTGNTDFLVVVTLKSNSSNPLLDYANNYDLVVNGSTPGLSVINALRFTLAPGASVQVEVSIDGDVLTGSSADTVPTVNVFEYDGQTTYSATVTIVYVGVTTTLTDANLKVTYYNVNNLKKPISAPTEPGSYLVKVQLIDIPSSDTNEYQLVDTDFYFDVEKGNFDANDIYWRYTHVDENGNTIVAKYDASFGIWVVTEHVDVNGAPVTTDSLVGQALAQFEYDGRTHMVELVSDDTNLVISTKNNSQLNAGKFTVADKTAAIASYSFNGKLWNDPPASIATTFEWEIKKAVLELSAMTWDYNAPYVYTISGGEEKTFTVKMNDVPTLIQTFVEYKTYRILDDGTEEPLDTHVLSQVGKYKTVFNCDAFLKDANEEMLKNYELDDETLAEQTLEWEIEVRVIDIPVSNGSWTEFDGNVHDLTSAITLPSDWEEYLEITLRSDLEGNMGDYDGIGEFGNTQFAMHAGTYEFTFSILEDINSDNQTNVKFNAADPLIPQTASIVIAKAVMYVDNWVGNAEFSTAVLSGNYASNEFVDYKFSDINTGTEVDIADVTASSGQQFNMTVYVKDEYANDITIQSGLSTVTITITTAPVDNTPANQYGVRKMPYIAGYEANGVYHEFDYTDWQDMMLDDDNFVFDFGGNVVDKDDIDENFDWKPYLGMNPKDADYVAPTYEEAVVIAQYKAKVRVNVIYGGFPIEFKVYDWDSYYSAYLDVWQGGLSQSEAGDYSITMMFKKNTLAVPYSWADGFDGTNYTVSVVDRTPVKLNYRISFRIIPLPEFSNPTYTGGELNVLVNAFGDEAEFDNWLNEYQEYFDISGATATLVGGYTLQLKIKDMYLNTIHWDNGTAKGQAGTFTLKWKVLPIYVAIPQESGATIVYDGSSHSVFETFEGYNGGALSDELKALIQLTQISGENGVNAGDYTARFMLPDSNYAWLSSTAGESNQSVLTFAWKIEKKSLDMSGIGWNYDEKAPFQFTVENGEVQSHTLKLTGIPAELEEFITYVTDGQTGNVRTDMGTYTTVIYFFQNNLNYQNYSLKGAPKEFTDKYKDPAGNGFAAITWKIEERKFAIPKDTTVEFDGTVRELLSLFGFAEGWDNYLNVEIEYKPLGADDDKYVPYEDIASLDELLEYSAFNAFYLGNYRVSFSIKSELNAVTECVLWTDGANTFLDDRRAVLTINPLELIVNGWQTESNPDSTPVSEWVSAKGNYSIISPKFDGLSDESKRIFEYVIRDQATGEIVTMAEVASRGAGIVYTIEFRIKDGNGYAMSNGIELSFMDGVENPFEFTNVEFTSNNPSNPQNEVVYWLPIPKLLPVTNNVYDGKDKVYQIDNWQAYEMSLDFKTRMMTDYGIDLTNQTNFLEPIGKHASTVDISNGKITIKSAGDFEVLVRLLPNVNLSWYNPDNYAYNPVTNTLTPIGSAAMPAPVDRKAKAFEISVKKASVPYISAEILEIFESMIPDFEYTGEEYDLTKRSETQSLFNQLASYGSLITFEGYKGTAAGDYKLVIRLTDPNSSYWNLGVNETVVVNTPSYDGYDADYQVKHVLVDGKWTIKYVKDDGKGGFIDYNDGNYNLKVEFKKYKVVEAYVNADGLLDENGMPETTSGAKYAVDENGKAVKYSIVEGKYVADPNGTLLARYKLDVNGAIIEMPETVDGKNVIDQAKSTVTITRLKTSTDPYEISWRIIGSILAPPTLNENVTLTYSGSEQSAEKALSGFNSSLMEIVDGASGKNAGEYTAKIRIKDKNYSWREGAADENGFVYVTWKIEKATVDLSNVKWKFTDGTNDYANGAGMVYTRKNGKAVVYWAELVDLPEAVKGAVRYTTNGVKGARAGKNAGKYVTSFEIVDPDGNFETITIPSTLSESVTWNIKRRILEVPSSGSLQMIFDDKAHDLLAMLNLQEDWAEYYTITVMYAKNFTTFDKYEGHDGNPYEAYGAGAYKFVFSILTDINTNAKNPSVAWLVKGSSTSAKTQKVHREVDAPVSTAVKETAVIPAPETVEEVETADAVTAAKVPVTQKTQSTAVTAVQQVCDRIKKLTYGAQLTMPAFRKYCR